MEYGVIGLIILILDIYALIQVFGSSASNGTKLIWVLAILFLPVIGLVAWWFIGPK